MKKSITMLGLASILVAGSMLTAPAYASSDPCSVENPCDTWAMVDDNGNIVNAIVCQESVCGSGEFAGFRVVRQVAADPATGENRGGYNQGSVDLSGTFTVGPSTGASVQEGVTVDVATQEVTPWYPESAVSEPTVTETPESGIYLESPTTTDSVTVSDSETAKIDLIVESPADPGEKTFRFEDTQISNVNEIKFGTPESPATLKTVSKNSSGDVVGTEILTIQQRKTKEDVTTQVAESGFIVMLGHIQKFFTFDWFSKWLLL